MNKKKNASVVEPRKEPKQERSRQTYQVILQGAAKIIRRDGIHKLSTNKVAEESGVSIGSLYQYFPSKEAIIGALIDQIFEYEAARLNGMLVELSPKVGAREIIKNFFALYYRVEPDDLVYRKALIGSVASVEKTVEALSFHRKMGEILLDYFHKNFPVGSSRLDQKTRVFMIQYMLRATALSSVDEEIDGVDKDALIEELAEILMNFLKIPQEYRSSWA
jgi:AcrR family transcriptional regulator